MSGPTDALIERYILADFESIRNIRTMTLAGMHLARCDERYVVPASAEREPDHSCGEGTCGISAEVSAEITCPHGPGWYRLRHEVSADSMADLIVDIARFDP